MAASLFHRTSPASKSRGNRACALLKHVPLALAVGLEGRAGRFDRGVEILHRMSAFLTDAVTELEPFDFTNGSHIQSTIVRAAARGARGRDDSTRVLILWRLRIRVLNDVLGQPM